MQLGRILNLDKTRELPTEYNAYVCNNTFKMDNNVNTQVANKVIFPEPYENANGYYNKSQFCPPPKPEPEQCKHHPVPPPMFDFKALLPMLMSGKLNEIINPLMSILGGKNGGTDIAKIFELFKPKAKVKKKENKYNFDYVKGAIIGETVITAPVAEPSLPVTVTVFVISVTVSANAELALATNKNVADSPAGSTTGSVNVRGLKVVGTTG